MRYKIEFQLKSVVAFACPITFDAILWHCYKKSADKIVAADELPLVKFSNGVYKASVMIISVVDNVLRAEAGSKLQDYNSHHLSILKFSKDLYQMDAFSVEFVFETADLEEVKKLLTRLEYIGAGRSRGYGKIAGMECKETEEMIIRPVPINTLRELNEARIIGAELRGFRPPYNNKSNIDNCVIVEF